MTSELPNLEPCDGCETPTNQADSNGTPLCAACVEAQARSLEVQKDLTAALEPVITAWAKRWHAAGEPLDALTDTIVDLNAVVPGPLEWVQAVETAA